MRSHGREAREARRLELALRRGTPDEVARFETKVAKHGGSVERTAELPADVQGRTIVRDGKAVVLLPEGTVKKFALIDELTHVLQIERAGPSFMTKLFDDASRGVSSALDTLRSWELEAKKMVLSTLRPEDPARPIVERSVRSLEAPTEAARLTALRGARGRTVARFGALLGRHRKSREFGQIR